MVVSRDQNIGQNHKLLTGNKGKCKGEVKEALCHEDVLGSGVVSRYTD
jgi:hypothetical protein